jgi:hypothetical protein
VDFTHFQTDSSLLTSVLRLGKSKWKSGRETLTNNLFEMYLLLSVRHKSVIGYNKKMSDGSFSDCSDHINDTEGGTLLIIRVIIYLRPESVG